MNWTVKLLVTAVSLLGALVAQVCAQEQTKESIRSVVEEARRTNPALTVRIDPLTGMPSSAQGLRPTVDPDVALNASRDASGRPSDADIIRAAEAFFESGELSAAFAVASPRGKIESLRVRRDPDDAGKTIVHVEQRVDGVPVFGSSGRVSVTPSLAVTQMTATFSTIKIDKTTPSIDQRRAIEVARERLRQILFERSADRSFDALRSSIDKANVKASLVIYDPALVRSKGSEPGTARLAWLTTIDAFRFFVDATDAKVLFYYLDQRWATLREIFDLRSSKQFPGTKVIDEASGLRIEPLADDARNAYTNERHVISYYARKFGRHGLGAQSGDEVLASFVRFGDMKNAYWCSHASFFCPKAGSMVYGATIPSAIDIVGHEMTHGVIAVEANLTYANESGALNEALADLFGTLIEFDVNPSSANWVLGERIAGYTRTSPVRNMSNPNLSDSDGKSLFDRLKPYSLNNRGQPDHYSDYVQRTDQICETTRDYYTGCVHFNSGIFNKFAFLIAAGGRHRGAVVKGIGREKLGRIAYRSLVVHLNPSSGMKEAAETFHTSCAELVKLGVGDIVQADCHRVRDAQLAVGLIGTGS